MEVDLTSSKLHSGFIWAQAVARLLLPWLRVKPLSQSSIVAKDELGNSFLQLHILPKGGKTLPIFIDYWMNSEDIHAL